MVLLLIFIWIAYKTVRQVRMRRKPIESLEDINDFAFPVRQQGGGYWK